MTNQTGPRLGLTSILFLLGILATSLSAFAEEFSLSGQQGGFAVSLSWMIDPFTGNDVLRGRIEYTPALAKNLSCRLIKAVQIARVQTENGKDYLWSQGQEARNSLETMANTEQGIEAGFFIDHDAIKCHRNASCSADYRDSWPNPDESKDGSVIDGKISPASMIDYPFGWDLFSSISLETCMQCKDDGRILDCVKWGARWPITENRSFSVISAGKPSATFLNALKLFQNFY